MLVGIVTRRPLVLQLHKTESGQQDYAEFLHLPRKKITDFGTSVLVEAASESFLLSLNFKWEILFFFKLFLFFLGFMQLWFVVKFRRKPIDWLGRQSRSLQFPSISVSILQTVASFTISSFILRIFPPIFLCSVFAWPTSQFWWINFTLLLIWADDFLLLAVVNLTLIDLPGLTKVAVGKLSRTSMCLCLVVLSWKKYNCCTICEFPLMQLHFNAILVLCAVRGTTGEYCGRHWKHGSFLCWEGKIATLSLITRNWIIMEVLVWGIFYSYYM